MALNNRCKGNDHGYMSVDVIVKTYDNIYNEMLSKRLVLDDIT